KHQRVALVSYTRHFASPELDGSDWLTVWVYSVNEWLTTAELLSRISEGCDRFEKSMLGVIAPDLIGRGDLDKIPAGAEPDRYRFASHTVVLTPSEPLTRRLSTAYDITPRRSR
ncbi:MAG: hypothetical protein WB495_18840, partial [Xanthobacteraceae bacterium]